MHLWALHKKVDIADWCFPRCSPSESSEALYDCNIDLALHSHAV